MTCLSYLALALCAISNASPNHGLIAPTDPHIRYVGRVDLQSPDGPRCAWPASQVQISFRGTGLKMKVKDSGQDQLQVIVDGNPTQVLKLEKGENSCDIASGLTDSRHDIAVVKRTETFVGTVQFLNFDVDGTLVDPPKAQHIIEVIGDSISCGYGNEGKAKEEHFLPATENAYMSYGAIAARELKSDFYDIAWSGRKMWPDNTVPEIYDLALADDKTSTWNLRQAIPDVIIINLATNDFGKQNPDEKGWSEAYAAFIQRLRTRAPRARIYCSIGPMMTDNWPPETKALSNLRKYLTDVIALRAKVADDNIRIIEFETQDEAKDGIGSDWHPSISKHRDMAKVLVAAIREDLHWK